RAVAALSTCQRTEVSATWHGEPNHPALLAALALDRRVSHPGPPPPARAPRGPAGPRPPPPAARGPAAVSPAGPRIRGPRTAVAEPRRAAGSGDGAREGLLDAAISASRKRQRRTSLLVATRSVAGVAIDAVTTSSGGTLTGKRLLAVGAGQVASVVVARAVEL